MLLPAAKASGSRGVAAMPLLDLGFLSEFYHFHLSCLPTVLTLSCFLDCLKDKFSAHARRLSPRVAN